ncbi:alpha/beta fold hydrolase [Pseudooceanicola sp. 200-1SW]|uniref:alpha/beta fold hydrolase n=1 Tax=Pseudooceanicola sp. 200-1SW TaxID=3425949 RepID=UPI003D7FF674
MTVAPLIGLLLGGGALAWAPFLAEDARPRASERRDKAPGEVADLPQGRTHYRWHGEDEDAPVAVLIHGLTTPSYVWDGVVPGLVDMGYRVLSYDLYGRGWSDRPPGAQDADFFLTQLVDLLEALSVAEPVTLFGYSMGGAIAAAFAARYPAQIEKLVLVAPAGMGGFPTGLTRWMRDGGWTGRWLFHLLYPRQHRRSARTAEAEGVSRSYARMQAAEADWRGFTPAVLSALRGVLRDPMALEHRKIAKEGLPLLSIWASEDRVIPLEGMGVISRWNRASVQKEVAGAGHWLPLSHPEAVVRAFRDWLWEDGEI